MNKIAPCPNTNFNEPNIRDIFINQENDSFVQSNDEANIFINNENQQN
jgi:hypothetical protein